MTELTWETATDWDSAASESGVVHESTGNTDHNDATIVKQGYPYGSFDEITPTPSSAWPLHEDSGSTANDLAGTSDGTINGATVGQTGILGTTAYSFDGTDDYVDFSGFSAFTSYTLACWMFVPSSVIGGGGIHTAEAFYNNNKVRLKFDDSNFTNRIGIQQGGNSNNDIGKSISSSGWYHVVGTWDGSTINVYVDAVNEGSTSESSMDSPGDIDGLGSYNGSNHHWDGRIADARLYSSALSASEVQTLYDVVDTAGTLTTATKTS